MIQSAASAALAAMRLCERTGSDVKSDLLALLLSKRIEFRSEIPEDWGNCVHVDLKPDENWLEDRFLRPALETLVSSLAHFGRVPIDFCAVKSPDVYSIVVRYEPLATIHGR